MELFANDAAGVVYGTLGSVGEHRHFFAGNIEAHEGTNTDFVRA